MVSAKFVVSYVLNLHQLLQTTLRQFPLTTHSER